jgi:DNA-binding transcriptional LysR family regulator
MFMESRMIRYRPDANKPASTTAGAIHYLMLVKVAGKDTETVINALIALGHILSNTDLIGAVPERYVREGMAPFKLRCLPHPVPLPEFDVNLFWHATYHKESGNQWLRSVIVELAIDQGVSPG